MDTLSKPVDHYGLKLSTVRVLRKAGFKSLQAAYDFHFSKSGGLFSIPGVTVDLVRDINRNLPAGVAKLPS